MSPLAFSFTSPSERPVDWRRRVAETLAGAATAVAAGDLDRLRAVFDDVDGWDDAQRAYQARSALADAVIASSAALPPRTWIAAYLLVAERLLAALERDPREPVLLNWVGVLLYEVQELRGAEAAFQAALRLDPELEPARGNLSQLRARRRAGARSALPPAQSARARGLGARARRAAAAARPARGLTLSVCMIVKDEEEMLPGCLEAVADVADEIVVVDTGSSDRTVEIARGFGARVLEFPWNGSFADARNVSLEAATGDWVLQLDADEHLVVEDAPKLRELLGQTWREGFYLVETHMNGGRDAAPVLTNHALRLWRHRPGYRFEGRIHEQKSANMPTYLPERFAASTIRMRHYGYQQSVMAAKDKARRNIELLELEAAEATTPFTDFNLGSEYLGIGEPARARTLLARSWDGVRAQQSWQAVAYVPLLVTRLVQSCRESGDRDAARRYIDEGLAAFPDHTDLVLEGARCARADGDLDGAAGLARRCLEMGDAPARYAAAVGSGGHLALGLLAGVREAQGDAAQAERLLARSLAEHPDYRPPILPLVRLRLARGASAAEALAAIDTDVPSGAQLAATALLECGEAAAAEPLFAATLARQPANGVARIGLVECLLSQRRYADAAEEAAREPHGSPLAALAARAALFARSAAGDVASVRASLAQASAAGMQAHDIELYRAWADAAEAGSAPLYVSGSALGEAATALEALLRVGDVDGFVSLLPVFGSIGVPARERAETLAQIYLRRGFLDSAADEWIAVAREAPDSRAMLGLAQVAVARHMHEDAAALAAEALALDPSSPEARRLVDALAAHRAEAA